MKMKKMVSALLLVVMIVGTATMMNSCGSDSKFVGKWSLTEMTYGEQDVKGTSEMDMKIESDGKFTVDADGTEGTGTWTEKDGMITLTDSTKVTLEGKIVDGNLEITYSGITMVLKKK